MRCRGRGGRIRIRSGLLMGMWGGRSGGSGRCWEAGVHERAMGRVDDLLVGLQLTHSGRFCRPVDKRQLRPRIAYHHPILDRKFGIAGDDDSVVLPDDEIERVIENYIVAAKVAQRVGFQFVDVKHCHGYLGHEMLIAFTRKGKFGGAWRIGRGLRGRLFGGFRRSVRGSGSE